MSKKTKIVCTIGPATESKEKLKALLQAGMNVMRLNFSHGDFAEHQRKVDNLRKAIKETGIPCAIMQDLSGPKFRLGDFYKDRVELTAGNFITLTTEKIIGDEKRVSVNYPTLHKEIVPGNMIMVDDGKKKFEVVSIKGKEIKCKIVVGGDTKGRRALNLPGAPLKINALTSKDKEDIEFGIKNDVDIFAPSFVRKQSDVVELRKILDKRGKTNAKIMPKIETVEAVRDIDSILEVVDMVLIARGDMGVELGHENVPIAQKTIIEKCMRAGKPVVTATQMLESMIKSPVPTRAEVSDVANAIFDGTDAVMLSEETTLGDYPVEAVKMMRQIAEKVESDPIYIEHFVNAKRLETDLSSNILVDAITSEVVDIAKSLDTKAIVVLTESGRTARMVSRYRSNRPIIAFTPNKKTYNQLQLSYGVKTVMMPKIKTVNEIIPIVRDHMLRSKMGKTGDRVVISAGIPFGDSLETNMILVETI